MSIEQTATVILAVADGKPHVRKSRAGNDEMPYGMEEFVAALDDVHFALLHGLVQQRAAKGTEPCLGSSSSSPSLSLTPG